MSEIAPGNHGPHVPDKRIARISVVDRADAARRAGGANDVFALIHRHRHRLFAKHMEPGLEKCLGDLKVRGVRRGDRDKIDPVGTVLFAGEHFTPVAIGAVFSDAETLREGTAGRRIVVERTGDEGEFAIDCRAKTVRGADLAALAASDHSPVQFGHRGVLIEFGSMWP